MTMFYKKGKSRKNTPPRTEVFRVSQPPSNRQSVFWSLASSISDRDRNAFLVHIHADILGPIH